MMLLISWGYTQSTIVDDSIRRELIKNCSTISGQQGSGNKGQFCYPELNYAPSARYQANKSLLGTLSEGEDRKKIIRDQNEFLCNQNIERLLSTLNIFENVDFVSFADISKPQIYYHLDPGSHLGEVVLQLPKKGLECHKDIARRLYNDTKTALCLFNRIDVDMVKKPSPLPLILSEAIFEDNVFKILAVVADQCDGPYQVTQVGSHRIHYAQAPQHEPPSSVSSHTDGSEMKEQAYNYLLRTAKFTGFPIESTVNSDRGSTEKDQEDFDILYDEIDASKAEKD